MMKHALTFLPHLLVQVLTALFASAGAILCTFTELPGLVLLGLLALFQLVTYAVIRGTAGLVQPAQELWLRVVQQVVGSVFVVMLLTMLAVAFWVAFEYSIWYVSGNSETGYTPYLAHVVVSVVPQVIGVLVLGEGLRQAVLLLSVQRGRQNLTTSD